MVPLIAMQFTNEVHWRLNDFVIIGILLVGAGLAVESIMRATKNKKWRLIFSFAVLGLLLLVWAELAVGVFGTPFAGS